MIEVVNDAVFGGGAAAGVFVGILLFLAIGRRIGRWVLSRSGVSHAPNVGSLEAAVFGLLGLIIAFTFSGALNRFDTRRIQVVDEVNAIGTAWLRVDLLPASAQPRMRELMRSYVDARIATYDKLPNVAAAQQEAVRSQKLQNEIWAHSITAIRMTDARPGTDLLVMPALNQMFDLASARLAATQIHPPTIIYALLIGLAFASALLAGYQAANENDPMHRFGFALIISLTIYVILEIEYPRLGFVRLDAIDQLLDNLRAGMN